MLLAQEDHGPPGRVWWFLKGQVLLGGEGAAQRVLCSFEAKVFVGEHDVPLR